METEAILQTIRDCRLGIRTVSKDLDESLFSMKTKLGVKLNGSGNGEDVIVKKNNPFLDDIER